MNFLDKAKSQLNAESLSGLADQLDIDRSALPLLIDEALSALFAIVRKAALDPSKSDLVTQLLSETDNSILDKPNEAITQYGSELMRGGKSGLARLLGPQLTDYLAPLAQSTALGEGKIASALGSLAPFVFAFLGQHAKDASALQELLPPEHIAEPTPASKLPTKTEATHKSYLPDPRKKRDKRPFPKRKAILLLIALALVAALLFWLVDTRAVPLPASELPKEELPIEPEQTPSPETAAPETAAAIELTP